ncbi:MAG: DUF3169 family protein [Staphylococcus rostri]|uniref:DUF3169 family protein n=1 Tax=Staphylococcus rostri TaxID=522262 RepID=UPI0026E08FDD|nr:DUF3169 family protein [Staphylococcus rostri]MDO5376333.1 DUF3169 family protein [Staphylococcus rostri]
MKVMRYILLTLLGGLIGGIIGVFVGGTQGFRFITQMHFLDDHALTIVACVIGIIILALLIYNLIVQKHALNYKNGVQQVASDMDHRENKADLLFWRASILNNLQLFIYFIFLLMLVLNNASSHWTLWIALMFFIVSVTMMPYNFFVRKFDPRFPKIGEKGYTEKTLALMDEGERHITLLSMYKLYVMNISLLMISIVIISIFSIESGVNQSFGLIILLCLFVYNVFVYLFRVRKYYK